MFAATKKRQKYETTSWPGISACENKRFKWFNQCRYVFNLSQRWKSVPAEQKITELKTRIAKWASQKLKISPNKIIEISTANMNNRPSKKYGLSPEEVERKALQSERFRAAYITKSAEV